MTGQIDHPPHYGGDTAYEAIKVIEAYGLVEDFRLASAYKYLSRAGKKGDELTDLQKALWYLTRYKYAFAEEDIGFPVYNGARGELPQIMDIATAMDLANPWAEEALICVLEIALHSDEQQSLEDAISATQKAIDLAEGKQVEKAPDRRQ